MPQISMKAFLESGVHFGHQTKRWNPKMKPYIFAARNGIYIIDLQKTLKYTKEAVNYIKTVVRAKKKVLFVGTKKQSKEAIKEEATRCGMPFIANRWLGGILTNFVTIKKRVARLKEFEEMEVTGGFDRYPVKERMKMMKEYAKLRLNLEGIKDMNEMPGAIFIIDTKREENAIKEGNKLKIPVVAVVDTNCDPDHIDYIIPGNDDAIRAVRLMSKIIADTIIEENQAMERERDVQMKAAADAIQTAADVKTAGEKATAIAAGVDYSQVFKDEPPTTENK